VSIPHGWVLRPESAAHHTRFGGTARITWWSRRASAVPNAIAGCTSPRLPLQDKTIFMLLLPAQYRGVVWVRQIVSAEQT